MSQSIIDNSSISTISFDAMETQSDFHSPLYGDSESIFQEEDFPEILINQFGKVLKISDESDSKDMPVLVTSTTSLEEQLQELQKKLIEKDAEIAALAAQVTSQASTSARTHVPTAEEGYTSSSSITQDELKTLIAEGIKEFQASINLPVHGFRKPYPAHYDTIPFPTGYQKPNFEKFDGLTSSPQEHLAHFYSVYGEFALSDALLIRQFVQSLKGLALTWYTQLQPGSIHTWDDLQRAFLAQFVSSKKKVSIIDLVDARQKSNESVNDFITRWRSLNLQCSEKLTEQSVVQMCSNNLLPKVAIFIGTIEPQSFDALEEPKSTLPYPLGAKPNNVEKIKKTLNVKAESSSLPSLYELMTKAKLDFWENSSKDGNEEEWQTYIGKQSKKMAKRPLPIIMPFEKPGVKIHERKDSKKNKKKKKNTQKKSMSLEEEKYIQSKRMPITLVEHLPKEFLQNHSEDEMREEVVQCFMVSIDDNGRDVDEVTLLSSQHLSLPQKENLSKNAKDDASKGKEGNYSQPLSPRLCVSCLACITFSDEDLQFGEKFQNQCLYVKGTIGDVSRILLDYGSTVNLLPYKTFKVMGMKSKQLSPSNLTIQNFNQVGQRAMGSISLKVEIGELYSEALFHVIDVYTSYNVLLGHPWVHTYGIIGFALHQCFKLCDEDGNVKMVYTNPNPFMGEGVNYLDAKF
ncbi:uncharacterized protein LOC142626006 [Castanea sativa]|uniref:uncharacterized protein LOC142626006 n=1 Tax=Castanea sativa TaxID=21020 RepID=UPI003F64EEA4